MFLATIARKAVDGAAMTGLGWFGFVAFYHFVKATNAAIEPLAFYLLGMPWQPIAWLTGFGVAMSTVFAWISNR